MNLRIQGNSLRLRVTQTEVAQLKDGWLVESFIEFGSASPLIYRLETSDFLPTVAATFDGQTIRVSVPAQTMTEWVEGDQVGIEAISENSLGVLIEKDFQCRHKVGEQDPDAYPHPFIS